MAARLLRRLLVVPSLVRQQKQKGREKLAATVTISGGIWLAPISSKEAATSLISQKEKYILWVDLCCFNRQGMSKEKNQKKRLMPLVVSWQETMKMKGKRLLVFLFLASSFEYEEKV
ncbi:uncharacterized protein LOC111910728 [Lactuca sativa]|uniref:uncharacterized protein LOC111910728 n=1 Tax=Lactuca sativa TaxID=4236 RepID=UPI000CD95049|nr:uncharacterized protein LOC111910728 [Lactuca sativa]